MEKEKIKLKAWFTYEKGGIGGFDYACTMVFENGWCPFGHCCSDPSFAEGDLWEERPERKDKMEELGVEVEKMGTIPVDELPEYVYENYKNEENWKEVSDKWKELHNNK